MGNVGSIFEKSNDQQGQQWQNMIGKTVAHYRITEKLGAGGMGEVYAAEDTRLGRTVALKFLPEESGKDRQLLERFLREARAASSLNHPNICTIHDIGEHEGRQYIVMERLEGRTIASIIASSPMPLGQMLDASIQIADALDATHSRGIIHRDIKPANLFITKRGHVKVLDFGLAKLTEPDAESQPPSDPDATLVRKIELTRTGATLGTVSYMSPEQARGEKLDHRSDIFSLGAVLYEMATGRDAFAGSSNAITFDNILNRQPPSPTRVNVDLPDDLDLIIARCLEKDPELRYQSAGDLRAALKRLRRDTGSGSSAEPLLTQTSDTPAPTPEPGSSGDPPASSSAIASEIIHHHKTGLLMSLAAIVVVIVGLAWLLAPYLTSSRIASSPGTPEAVDPGIDANEAEADSDRTNDLTQLPGDGIPRLAVLPFTIHGNAPDAEYLADEIPASIIDSMATLSGLKVVPRSSAFRYRDSTEDVTAIGRKLGADYVLTGQITARSGTMRIRAELIDVATDSQQWSERFDQSFEDTLEVETEFTRRLADALRVQITGEEQAAMDRRRPVNREAHAACLEGRFWWNKRSAEGLLRAIDLYKKAVRLDPDYALAHTGMGEVYLMMGIYSHRPKEVMPQAHVALNRAIEIDDGLPEPHAGLGFYYNVYAWDWDTSEAYFKHALQLDSDNAMAQVWYSVLLRFQARWDDAQTHLDRAVALEPGAGFIRHEAVLPMFDQRDFARAAPFFKQVTEMHPEYKTALGSLGSAYFYLGRHDEAFELLQHYVTSEEASSYQLGWYGYFLGLAGRRAEALEELNRLEELASRRYVPAYALAQVYAGLGDADRLFEMFNRAIDERSLRVLMLRILDFFDPYRQDPRYPELLRRIGLPLEPIDLPDLNIEIPHPSVAVLPFEMTTADADAAYLADEIPASVIDALSNISFLHVIPRSSSFRLRGSTDTIPEIGKALDADFVLTGQIVPRDGDLRIRAELVATDTNRQLFGDQFDQSSDDTLAAETEITDRIIDALKLPVSAEESQKLSKRRPLSAEAHAAYLEGRFWWNKRTPVGLDRAIGLFEKAAEIDPKYALAYVGQAETYVMMSMYSRRPHDVIPKALAAANRALELDPNLAAAHSALGFSLLHSDLDWEAAEMHLRRAIEVDPGYATAHQWYAMILLGMGRFEEAQRQITLARDLEPGSIIINYAVALVAYVQREFPRAERMVRQTLEMDPSFVPALGLLRDVQIASGRYDEAVETAQRMIAVAGEASVGESLIGYAYALSGRRAEALEELNRLTQEVENRNIDPSDLVFLYAVLGDFDRAFDLLSPAIEKHEFLPILLKFNPDWDVFRHDPRFDELLKTMRFPADPSAPVVPRVQLPIPSVAVLPFEMTGVDADAAYLADEIPASVIDSLSNISFVHVIPRSSSFRHRDSMDTVQQIGEALNADFVLTGQIVPRAGELRIRAELVSVRSNRRVWGDRLDRSTEDTLLVETEITDRIIETLKLPVTDEETQKLRRRRPVNTEAHAAYLEGHFWWNKRTPKGLDRAIELYDKAIEIDPQYALAHAGRAETYVLMGTYSGRAHDSMPEALASAERAIELDSMLAAPHAVLGQYHSLYSWDWAAAEVAYARAIELDPDYATALMWFADCLIFLGRLDEAQTLYDRAAKLEPSSMITQISAGIPALLKRQFTEAQLRFKAVLVMDPNFSLTHVFLGETLLGQGRFDEAIEQYRLAILREDAGAYILGALGRAYGLAGRREEALQELQRLTKLSETRIVPHSALAEVYFGLGDLDQAFALLDLAADEREFSIVLMKFDPTFDVARHDPRFDALLDRIGFPANPPAPVVERIEIPRPSVAVLPFEMTRADEDADYLADEIPASVIDSLSNISFVHVIPRSSSFRHRDSTDTIQQIGQALGADFVLTGQIIPRGNELRIRAELVSVRTNRQLFSERLDRSVSNTLALEIDFTEQIVETLQLPVTRDESQQLAKRRPVNPEAHAAYLQGRFQWNKRTKESILLGLKYFEQAAALDPTYARAYAGIADSHYIMTNHGFVTSDVALPKIHAALDKALQLDPNLAEVHITKGSILTDYDYDHEGAEREFKLGLSLEPEYATGHQWYGSFLHSLGRIEEGLAHLELARELDPYSAVISHTVAMAYRSLGRIEDAIAADWTAIELNDFKWAKTVLIEIHLNTNRVDELYETLGKFGESSALIAEAKAAFENEGIYGLGRVALRSHFLNEDGTPRYHSPALLAIYESLSGNKVRAIELLEQAYKQHDGLLMAASIHTNPSLALVRDDPRCQKILHDINIID